MPLYCFSFSFLGGRGGVGIFTFLEGRILSLKWSISS